MASFYSKTKANGFARVQFLRILNLQGDRVIVLLLPLLPEQALVAMTPIQLSFPLNVYAQTLLLEYGSCDHLHFGVFDDAVEETVDYPTGQQRAQDLFCSLLVPAPARILEIGCGSGALSRQLAALGYQVTALSSNSHEIDYCLTRDAGRVEYRLADFTDFNTSQLFDIVVFQQSVQYFDPLLLFGKLNACLKSGGQLLIVDEFLLDDRIQEYEPRTLLVNFLRLAERNGFSEQTQQELGPQLVSGLALFVSLLHKHADAIVAALGIEAEVLGTLQDALTLILGKYRAGLLGYTMLDLRRDVQDKQPEFGNIHAFNTDEVKTLFERSFGTTFDPSVWDWKYGDGRGRVVCARLDGALVAHYGGAPRLIRYFGEQAKAIQICDVMVLPEHRSFISRDTLFFKTAATFLEQEVGNCAEHLLGFGFPNMRVLQVAKRLGLYDVTDSFIEIHYAVGSSPVDALAASTRHISPYDLCDVLHKPEVNRLWEAMAQDLSAGIIGTRDWDYLYYRYVTHPLYVRGAYVFQAVFAEGTSPLVLAVLKKQEGGWLLMDLIGPVAEFHPCLLALVEHYGSLGQQLSCRVTSAYAPLLSLSNSQVQELGIDIPCNVWTRGPSVQALKGAWWLTAGDMDFI